MVTDEVKREVMRGARALRIFTTIMAGSLAFAFVYDVKWVMEIVVAAHAVLWFSYSVHLTGEIRRHLTTEKILTPDRE